MNRSKIGMVFPFKKPSEGIPISAIECLAKSKRFDFNTIKPWSIPSKGYIKDHYLEGFTVEMKPEGITPQHFSIRSILGREMSFPMKPIPVVVVPAISITTEGIGGFFEGIKVLTVVDNYENVHRSKIFNVRNKYAKGFRDYLISKYGRHPFRAVLFPFRNFYTTTNDGHLCLNGDDRVLMQNAYEATKKELKELFERNYRYLGAKSKNEFEKFMTLDSKEPDISNFLRSYMFGWFVSAWQKHTANEVLRLLQNFNMGYATDDLHPDMPLAADLMKFYNERIKEKDVKSKRVYWTTKTQNSADANDAERRGWAVPGLAPEISVRTTMAQTWQQRAEENIIHQAAFQEWVLHHQRQDTIGVRRPVRFEAANQVVQVRDEARNIPEVVVIQPPPDVIYGAIQNQAEVPNNEPNNDGRTGTVGEGSGEDVREADH